MHYRDARDQFIWQFATWKGHCKIDIGEMLLRLYPCVGGPFHPDYSLGVNLVGFDDHWKTLIRWPSVKGCYHDREICEGFYNSATDSFQITSCKSGQAPGLHAQATFRDFDSSTRLVKGEL